MIAPGKTAHFHRRAHQPADAGDVLAVFDHHDIDRARPAAVDGVERALERRAAFLVLFLLQQDSDGPAGEFRLETAAGCRSTCARAVPKPARRRQTPRRLPPARSCPGPRSPVCAGAAVEAGSPQGGGRQQHQQEPRRSCCFSWPITPNSSEIVSRKYEMHSNSLAKGGRAAAAIQEKASRLAMELAGRGKGRPEPCPTFGFAILVRHALRLCKIALSL